MSKTDKSPAQVAPEYGVGKIQRHLFVCLGPDCCDPDDGEATWKHIKKRLKELELSGADGSVYRTKCQCLRVCNRGPIAVVYPEGAWYRDVNEANAERIIREHLVGGSVVEELCFARNALPGEESESATDGR